MDVKKLDKYAELLLDTGKRNPLINFKDSKSSTVEVVLPSADYFFYGIREYDYFEVFDANSSDDSDAYMDEVLSEMNDLLDVGELNHGSRQASFDHTLKSDQKNARSPLPLDKKEKYIHQNRLKLTKKNQILLYQSDANPIAVLKKISKKAKEFIEETGVHVAYLAFGFIQWSDKTASENSYRAPVLLVPVQIEPSASFYSYRIAAAEDDVIVNPTFSYKLEAEFGIKFPEYNDEGLSAYLEKVSNVVKSLNWTVSNECKLGIFSFLKINMYRDLKDNADKILANPNVRALLGEPFIAEDNDDAGKTVINPLIELHNVVDADSSQMDAIEMAKSGKSFVLQGPPGTGKSQTITNIIAECLCDGKKVLFVSEKLAALNVVYDKLKQVGFEDFCLQLHSHKAKKKEVIAEICHVLRKDKYSVSSMVNKEIEIKQTAQQQLDNYAAELHKLQPVIDKSLYQFTAVPRNLKQRKSSCCNEFRVLRC